MTTRKPSVLIKCVANNYAAPNERIVEFDGGLIRFVNADDGMLYVSLYRLDNNVRVYVDKTNLVPETLSN